MNKKIKFLSILMSAMLLLSSCFKTAKDLIVTGEYVLASEEPITVKNAKFNSSTPDKYRLDLVYFRTTITEIDYKSYQFIENKNKKINDQIKNKDYSLAKEREGIFTPQNEYIYFKIDFFMQFNLYTLANQNDDNPTLESTSPDQSEKIYGTHVGRYNHELNTYYFLLDLEDPSYKGASEAGVTTSACLLAALFIENPTEVVVRLSSRIGSLYSNTERWYKQFDLKYVEPEPVDPQPYIPEEA